MAYAANVHTLRQFDQAPSLFARLRTTFAEYRLYRETLTELERMTDRELLDLNLSRHALRDVARAAAYGR